MAEQIFDETTLSVHVRTFDGKDQDQVSRLYADGLLAGELAPNDTGADIDNVCDAYFDDPRHHLWVAELDGRIIGMVGVGSDEEHTAEVRRLRVEPDYQHTALAVRLLETALKHCKDSGFLKIRLDTRFDKSTALEHFDRLGFQHTRTREVPGKELLEFYLDLYRDHTDNSEARNNGTGVFDAIEDD